MARRNPSKIEELEQEKNELISALEDIAGMADAADDAALPRESLVEKIREIAERVEDEIDLDGDEDAALGEE